MDKVDWSEEGSKKSNPKNDAQTKDKPTPIKKQNNRRPFNGKETVIVFEFNKHQPYNQVSKLVRKHIEKDCFFIKLIKDKTYFVFVYVDNVLKDEESLKDAKLCINTNRVLRKSRSKDDDGINGLTEDISKVEIDPRLKRDTSVAKRLIVNSLGISNNEKNKDKVDAN